MAKRHGFVGIGLVTRESVYPFRETVSKLEQTARASGAYVFSRIDHSGNAKHAGFALRPTELLIFGKPAVSTPLLRAHQTIGLDLPLRVVVWRDKIGTVWVTYNDIEYVALRHNVRSESDAIAGIHEWFDAVVMSVVRRR